MKGMETRTYTPAIIAGYEQLVESLEKIHKADEKRIIRVTKRDLELSDELDALEYGFVYGGNK